ncbi:phosphonate ABC transporter, permease protein PhnE [Pseudogracilibacillus auburnensis]|uniref:phosphonate ABC transporter, permease protein PhnE n=1 Tax=Pseudogracilibacillus auburnensis TaxID=1494959 RepID=UPI001A9706BD|nr:phosphonate ABC transporter, permease protein PhnE [Pseudogracilibacillus auburnensis]MBO1002618.1 phosphonate ABC transporter, permease protein PhnE [Pseudogracilibacillus auburnensis]
MNTIEKEQTDHIPSPPSKMKPIFTAMLVLVLVLGSGWQIGFSFTELLKGLPNMWDLVVQLVPPDLAYFQVITSPMLETIRMAVIGTTFGGLLAFPLAMLAARNVFFLSIITGPARFLLNLIRTLPELLLAALFVAIFGIGPIPGIFALMFFSLGIIAKLFYESVESIDPGPMEAMTAVGANKLKWIMFGVVPQVMAPFMSFFLYAFEINIRAAAVLGLVGAGGIGLFYEQTLGFFDYAKTSSIIVYTLGVVLLIDYLSTKIREKLI